MTEMVTIYTKSKGVTINIDLGLNIESATTAKILYEKPSGKTGEVEATLGETSISFTTPLDSEFFDEEGLWSFQPYVESPIWKVYGQKVSVSVRSSIQTETE